MIRILESKTTDVTGKYWYYLLCDEGDTKPAGEFPADSGKTIANGSRLFENGTEIRYEYNNGSWTAVGQVDTPAPVLEILSVTPTTSAQSITPESPVDGYSSVSVSAVTAAIDQNIVAGNIKKDVQILGVTGSYEGSSGGYNATLEVEGTEFIYSYAVLTSISIPNGVETIGDEAFYDYSSLTAITLPSSVTSIGENAFWHCRNLADVTISESLETIGENAFYGCYSLTAITLPSSVTSIGDGAFEGCTSLTTITINKAEGSISGAPWGAENATVVWNG